MVHESFFSPKELTALMRIHEPISIKDYLDENINELIKKLEKSWLKVHAKLITKQCRA